MQTTVEGAVVDRLVAEAYRRGQEFGWLQGAEAAAQMAETYARISKANEYLGTGAAEAIAKAIRTRITARQAQV